MSGLRDDRTLTAYDAFDLPEWIGTSAVTWRAGGPLAGGPRVQGTLTGPAGESHPLGLLAVDAAQPRPVCPEAHRVAAHHAWQIDEVALLGTGGHRGHREREVVAAVPGTRFDANLVCEVLRRVAKAVGASAGAWYALVHL